MIPVDPLETEKGDTLRLVAWALLSAVLLTLAHTPFRILILPFTALAPLVAAAGSLPGRPGEGRRATWLGLSFGALFWGVHLLWVPLVVAPFFPWAYTGYGLQVGLLASIAALSIWATHRLHARAGVPLPLAFALAWVAGEWLKSHFPLGLSFPWLGLGISLTAWPELLGIAEWTGEAGVAFWLALVNGLVGSVILQGMKREGEERPIRGRGPARALSLSLGLALAPAILGVVRSRTLPLREGPVVAVVGTGVRADLRLRQEEGTLEALAQVDGILKGLGPGEADLVVLPEATVSLPLNGPTGTHAREVLGETARFLQAPLLIGGVGELPGPADLRTNSAFLMGPGGAILSRYDKVRLVPGMEWGGYRPGVVGEVLQVGRWHLGPLICYESLFGGIARAQRQNGAALLVNLSSDVWFGEERRLGALFLQHHPAHLVMRSVENRMGVARAANGGIGLLLDPLGKELVSPLPPGPGLIRARVPQVEGLTVFSRTGDLVGPGTLLVALALLSGAHSREGRGPGRRP